MGERSSTLLQERNSRLSVKQKEWETWPSNHHHNPFHYKIQLVGLSCGGFFFFEEENSCHCLLGRGLERSDGDGERAK